MYKEALMYAPVDLVKAELEKNPHLISLMYRTLPSNIGLTVSEFLQLKNAYAPWYVPSRQDSDIAILQHANQAEVQKRLFQQGISAIGNFIEKLQYILTQNISDQAREEANYLITKLTFSDTK